MWLNLKVLFPLFLYGCDLGWRWFSGLQAPRKVYWGCLGLLRQTLWLESHSERGHSNYRETDLPSPSLSFIWMHSSGPCSWSSVSLMRREPTLWEQKLSSMVKILSPPCLSACLPHPHKRVFASLGPGAGKQPLSQTSMALLKEPLTLMLGMGIGWKEKRREGELH